MGVPPPPPSPPGTHRRHMLAPPPVPTQPPPGNCLPHPAPIHLRPATLNIYIYNMKITSIQHCPRPEHTERTGRRARDGRGQCAGSECFLCLIAERVDSKLRARGVGGGRRVGGMDTLFHTAPLCLNCMRGSTAHTRTPHRALVCNASFIVSTQAEARPGDQASGTRPAPPQPYSPRRWWRGRCCAPPLWPGFL